MEEEANREIVSLAYSLFQDVSSLYLYISRKTALTPIGACRELETFGEIIMREVVALPRSLAPFFPVGRSNTVGRHCRKGKRGKGRRRRSTLHNYMTWTREEGCGGRVTRTAEQL